MKNIVICCDGTGNEISENISNVLKLYRMLRKTGKTEPYQVVFYDPGLGTLARLNPRKKLRQDAFAIFGLATGYGLDDNVLDAYGFLIDNYEEGDDIYLFGFSRGGYTVRVLAGLIHKVGLVSKPQSNLAGSGLTAYKQLTTDPGQQDPLDPEQFVDGAAAEQDGPVTRDDQAAQYARILSVRWPTIKFVGVWDTVASVSLQVWFAGVHADIGGGYPEKESGLSKYPLIWIVEEAVKGGLAIDRRTVNQLAWGKQGKGSPFSYVAPDFLRDPHDSMSAAWRVLEFIPKADEYKEWKERQSFLGHYIPDAKPRLVPLDAFVHESVVERMHAVSSYRPINLPSRHQVIPMPSGPTE